MQRHDKESEPLRMKLKRLITAAAASALLTVTAPAQTAPDFRGSITGSGIMFTGLSTENGLSQNSVATIAEDREGNIWMGTGDGLNRYDGYDIRLYRHTPGDSFSLQSSIINKVYRDSDGRLWICSADGLSIYDDLLDRFDRIQLDGLHSIEDIVELQSGKMLLTTRNASFIFTLEDGSLEEFRPDGKPLRFYCSLRDGDDIILCTMARNIEVFSTKDGRPLRKHNPLQLKEFGRAILKEADGKFIVGTNGSGTVMADFVGRTVTPVFSEAGKFVNVLARTNDSLLWVGGADGLRAYRDRTPVFSSDTGNALERLVRSACIDHNGGLWIGTSYVGVKYWNGKNRRFSPLCFNDAPEALSEDITTCIKAGPDGSLWVGTRYGGLFRHNASDGITTHYDLGNVHCLHFSPDGGTVYAGSEINGLGIIDLDSGKIERISRPADIMAIGEASDGKLWLGTLVGLHLFSPRDRKIQRIESGNGLPRILSMEKDAMGRLWVGAKESLRIYETDLHNSLKDVTPDEFSELVQVQCLCSTDDGTMWIGTADGLSEWRADIGLCIAEGLESLAIRGIEKDGEGNLWLSTDKSLCRYFRKSGETRFYSTANGFSCSQFITNAHCRDRSGTMYFGGIGGISVFTPSSMSSDSMTVAPVLTSLRLNNAEVKPGDGTGILSVCLPATKSIKLKHFQNSISLRFSCPDFAGGQGNTFRYRMDGVDREWVQARSREATYANLDKGNYTFRVAAANRDGVFHPEEAVLKIKVLPVWYRSTTAEIIFALAVAALLAFAAHKMVRRLNLRNERRMAQMAQEYESKIRRARIDRFISPAYQARPQDEELLTKVLEQIDAQCSNPEFGVEKLAEAVCMSRGNLHLRVKTITGRTVIELITTIRMEKACALLKEGQLTIAEIAEQTGFQTASYFITAFKKSFGTTPGRYAASMK